MSEDYYDGPPFKSRGSNTWHRGGGSYRAGGPSSQAGKSAFLNSYPFDVNLKALFELRVH